MLMKQNVNNDVTKDSPIPNNLFCVDNERRVYLLINCLELKG